MFRDSAGPDIALVEVSTALILYKTAFSQQQQILMWKTEQIMSVDDVVEFATFQLGAHHPRDYLNLIRPSYTPCSKRFSVPYTDYRAGWMSEILYAMTVDIST